MSDIIFDHSNMVQHASEQGFAAETIDWPALNADWSNFWAQRPLFLSSAQAYDDFIEGAGGYGMYTISADPKGEEA